MSAENQAESDYTPRERAALSGEPGFCRSLSPDRRFMCDRDAGHDGDCEGFELPTITLDEPILPPVQRVHTHPPYRPSCDGRLPQRRRE